MKKTLRKNHKIIPFFIPFLGCKQKCIYCNQHLITGSHSKGYLNFQEQKWQVVKITQNLSEPFLVGFYGGTFLDLSERYLKEIFLFLNYINKNPYFNGIRFSTTPESVLKKVDLLEKLKKYKLNLVELGVQTFSSEILKKIGRKGNLSSIIESVEFLRGKKIPYGIQLLLNLPGENPQLFLKKVNWFFDKYRPATVRLYPLVVLRETALAEWVKEGKYKLPSWEETVKLTASLYALSCYYNVKVLKIGLHTEKEMLKEILNKNYFYPQIAENTKAYLLLNFVDKICRQKKVKNIVLEVPPKVKSWLLSNSKKIFTLRENYSNIIKLINGSNKIRLFIGSSCIWEGSWVRICVESGKAIREELEEEKKHGSFKDCCEK